MTTSDPLRLVIRADAGPAVGAGHVMRMIALSQAWLDLDLGPVTVVSASLPEGLRRRCEDEGLRVRLIQGPSGSEHDASQLGDVLCETRSVVAIDGYCFGGTYQRQAGASCERSLVVDDIADQSSYDADIILNQNVHAAKALYDGKTGARLLLGLDFCLLRREFTRIPRRTGQPQRARKLLVSFGGADPHDTTGVALEALRVGPASLEVTVLVGAANPRVDATRARAAEVGARVLVNATNMPELLADADLALIGAGSTLWEALYLGVPTLCVVLAENQAPLASTLSARGAAVSLGDVGSLTPAALSRALEALTHDDGERERMVANGATLVDGQGARRVAAALASRPIETE